MLAYTDHPEAVGLDFGKIEQAYTMLENAVQNEELMGAVLQVSRNGVALQPGCFGRRALSQRGDLVKPDTIFPIASITKPIVAAAIMILIERGKLNLDDNVMEWVAEFDAPEKDEITVRHLLTHTSGVRNLPSDHIELRKRNAPLSDFVKHTGKDPLLFKPGTQVGYTSGGFAILGEIVERVENISLRDFLRDEIFQPLGLKATSLGMQADLKDLISEVAIAGNRFENNPVNARWNLNSEYWMQLGAPWGGMFTTSEEMTILLQVFLNTGTVGGIEVLSPQIAEQMISNQLMNICGLPEDVRLKSGRGFGWNLKTGPGFGRSSYSTFAHRGATGTVAWADPETQLACVFFTNDPDAFNKLSQPVAECVADAVC